MITQALTELLKSFWWLIPIILFKSQLVRLLVSLRRYFK